MPYTPDIYGKLREIADLSGAPETYTLDLYGQIRRTADMIGADGSYTNDKYGQLRRIADGISAPDTFPLDIFGQIRRIAETQYGAGSGGYTPDIYGQLTRIALLGGASIPFAPGAYSGVDFSVPTYYRTATIAGLRVVSGEGMLSEEAYGNGIRNSIMTGLTAGTIGSGGALPTNWQTGNSVGGFSVTVASATLLDGSPAIDVRMHGTPSGSGGYLLQFEATNQIVCSIAEVWTSEFEIAVVGGSLTNINSMQVGYVERNSAGTFQNAKTKQIKPFVSAYQTRQFLTTAVTAGDRLCPHLGVSVTSGNAIDVTFRIGNTNAFLSSKALSYGSAASRAADAISTPVTGGGFQAQAYGSAYDGTLLNIVNVGNDGVRLYRTARELFAVVAVAGVEGTPENLGRWPDRMIGTVTITATSGGNADVKFNGKAAVSIAGAATYTTVHVGCKANGSDQWNGRIRTLGQWLGVPTLTPNNVGMFDDFKRANGAIGSAWTGQPWVQVAAGGAVVVAAISGNELVATDSGQATTAAYNGFDNGTTISEMFALFKFGAGTNNGSITLVSNPNGFTVADKTASCVHIVFVNNKVDIAIWDAEVYTILASITYLTACAKDGTVYSAGFKLSGSSIKIFMPDGNVASYVDARFATLGGRYGNFEHYWTAGNCQPTILAAWAR